MPDENQTVASPLALTTPPLVQNPTDDGVTISWGVSQQATGWVEYGLSPDNLSQRAVLARHGLIAIEKRFLSVRLKHLGAGARVHYRTVSTPVVHRNAYDIHRGEPAASEVYSFSTLNPDAPRAAIACINDTHRDPPTVEKIPSALRRRPMDVLVLNGDTLNDMDAVDHIAPRINGLLGGKPAPAPFFFIPGNHEMRGGGARQIEQLLRPRENESPLGWCFAARHGPLAIIGMDTGEDKPDWRDEWFGLAAFEPYREQQRDWLAAALERPQIKNAPFVILFCHIPLNGLPGQNGGDTGGGSEDYAKFSRQCHALWAPLLERHHVQLVISGHTHQHRYDAPADGRSWGQLVGGGPTFDSATILRADADAARLKVTSESLDGRALGEWTFAPRRV